MEKLWTVSQIAVAFQVHPDTVRIWLRARKLKGIKLGKAWRIPDGDLQRFSTQQSQE